MRKAVDAEYGTESGKNQGNEPEINLVWQILSSSLPAPEKVYERVARECSSVTLAGTETTGGALSFIAFLLLDHPTKLARLKKEIGDAEQQLGRQLTYQELKELPYLVGKMVENSIWTDANIGDRPERSTKDFGK
jgi:cytochrome P450